MRARGEKRAALRRVLAAALCLCMVLSLFTGMTLRGSETSDTPQPAADEVVVVPEIVDPGTADQPAADVPADQPVTEPETEVPSEPEPTPEPVVPSEPEQTAEPTEPEATPEPVVPVEPTAEPEATPEPGTEITPEPEATEEPIPTPEIRDDVCKHHPVHTPGCFFEQNGFCGFQCPICDPELFGGITGAVNITVAGTVSAQKPAEEGGPVRADLLAGVDARDLEGAGCAVAVYSVVDSQGQPVTVIDGRYIDVTPGQNYVIIYVATNETGMILAAADRELSAEAAIAAAGSEFTIDGQPAQSEFTYEQNGLTVKLTFTGAAVTKTAANAAGEAMPAAQEAVAPAESLLEPKLDVTLFEEGSEEYGPFAAWFESGEEDTEAAAEGEDPETADAEGDLNELLALFVMKPELTLNGAELDLSACTAKAEITVTQAVVPQDEIATIAAGEEEEHMVTVSALRNGMAGVEEVDSALIDLLGDEPAAVGFEDIPEDGIMVVGVEDKANVDYTIQTYLWYEEVQRDTSGGLLDASDNTGDTYWLDHVVFISTENQSFKSYGENHDETFATYNQGGNMPENGDVTDNAAPSGDNPGIISVLLALDGSGYGGLDTTETLVPLFIDEPASYREKPQIGYMSRLFNTGASEGGGEGTKFNENYTMEEVWVYQPQAGVTAKDPATLLSSDFTVYQVPSYMDGGITRHLPELIRFTNNPQNPHITANTPAGTRREAPHGDADLATQAYYAWDRNMPDTDYPYVFTILITADTVIRFVYAPTQAGSYLQSANFFDYDITDGHIYDNLSDALDQDNQLDTSTQKTRDDNGQAMYAYTYHQGINSGGTEGSGPRYAFGNGNTGSGWMIESLGSGGTYQNYINQFNNNNVIFDYRTITGGRGCTFGLVTGVSYDATNGVPTPTSTTVALPNDLFSLTSRTGKTVYSPLQPYNGTYYGLVFNRTGGTYILDRVQEYTVSGGNVQAGESSGPYSVFHNTYTTGRPILGNLFWPMDMAPTYGADGHDLKHGNNSADLNRSWVGGTENDTFGTGTNQYDSDRYPVSDEGNVDHNAYMGMSYNVGFTIQPGYIGPLEYWFYGDDDMWVFLTDMSDGTSQLVADIGGVHSSVGTCVNLWDYITPIPYKTGDVVNTESNTYRLTIFYTERGESGSTCYMRFTVPLEMETMPVAMPDGEIVVEKQAVDTDGSVVYADGADRMVFDSQTVAGDDWPDVSTPAVFESRIRNNEAGYQVRNGFYVFRITMQSNEGVRLTDLYDYEIYRKTGGTNTTEHGNAVQTGSGGDPVEYGTLVPSDESGVYYFALKSDEYIVIKNLPDNTMYNVQEVNSANYVTGWQSGYHRHGADGTFNEYLDEQMVIYNYSTATGDVTFLSAEDNNYVRFTNSTAIKTEIAPGDGEGVQVGDEITYQIEWHNDGNALTNVIIRDKLDQGNGGVDFVGATLGEYSWTPTAEDIAAANESGDPIYTEIRNTGTARIDYIIYFPEYDYTTDASYHEWFGDALTGTALTTLQSNYAEPGVPTVVWITHGNASGASGEVTMTVRVNELARTEETQPGKFGTTVPRVENQGSFQVGNNSLVMTNEVENPVWDPQKTETHIDVAETTAGHTSTDVSEPLGNLKDYEHEWEDGLPSLQGPEVFVGDRITYRVTWKNWTTDPSQVTVMDPLDPNVQYVADTAHAYYYDMDTDGKPLTSSRHDVTGAAFAATAGTGEYAGRTVLTWDLGTQAPGVEGYVEFQVMVLDTATPVGEVWNNASVRVVNENLDDTEWTNHIENPTPQQRKVEGDPNSVPPVGPLDGDQVQTGDNITYHITWQNYKTTDAQVFVNDPLDPGLDFVSAKFGTAELNYDPAVPGTNTASGTVALTGTAGAEVTNIPVTISYDQTTHTVHWTIGEDMVGGSGTIGVPAGATGTVDLVVKVNANGLKRWTYDVNDDQHGRVPTDLDGVTEKDYEVLNRANVQVDNDPLVRTEIVENPIPEKTETAIDSTVTGGSVPTDTDTFAVRQDADGTNTTLTGPQVRVGDKITYTIHWKNGYDEPAEVTVTDPLDRNVEFVSAAYNAVTLSAGGSGEATDGDVTIRYNAGTRTVTWSLGQQPAGTEGNVTLTVEVQQGAVVAGTVENQAEVQVGSVAKQTYKIENPVPELEKTEPSPGPGNQVMEGDEVRYAIAWNNYRSENARVILTDYLDPGVDFKYAEFGNHSTEDEESSNVLSQSTGSVRLEARPGEVSAYSQTGTVTLTTYEADGVTVKANHTDVNVTIAYDPAQHLITWTLGRMVGDTGDENDSVPAGFLDEVRFAVTVNSRADDRYTYPAEGEQLTATLGDTDYRIFNRGGLQVNNDDKLLTNIIENPTKPKKTETQINGSDVTRRMEVVEDANSGGTRYPGLEGSTDLEKGPNVYVGDIIDYTITWLNTANGGTPLEPGDPISAAVSVEDKLDPGVTFVSASYESVVLNAGSAQAEGDVPTNDGTTAHIVIKYDEATHTVTWDLGTQGPRARGIVNLEVRVNENAGKKADGFDEDTTHADVVNQAAVTVGNETRYTDRVENLLFSDLMVTKTVTGIGDGQKEFSFTVSIVYDGDPINGWYPSENDPHAMYFENDVAHFTLKHGEYKLAKGLPAPFSYTVVEDNANQDGYTTSYEGDQGTVEPGQTGQADFTNYFPPPPTPTPPGGGPHKTETDPGDKVPVEVGQYITYRIDWVNYKSETATVTIRDPLDIGVDFYAATYQDHTMFADQQSMEGDSTGPNGPTKWRISQGINATTNHTEITWELGEKAAGASGSVYLQVLVTDRAVQKDDLTVYNQAFVKINGDPEQETEIPENPVPTPGGGPHKVETVPGDKLPVKIGDQITYRIDWENYRKEAATVAIRDPLDPGVKFVSASYGGVTLTADNDSIEHDAVTADNRTVHITIRQGTDAETGRTVVYWDLGEHPSTFKDSVYLTVEVTEKALENADLTVYNQAFVKVNGDPEQETEIPENPIPTPDGQPHKVETDPGDKVPVQVGQEITYRIDWVNYRPVAATVSVRDPLDPGVEFVSASYGGVTLTADQTSTQGDARTADNRTVHISMWQGTDTDTGRTVVYWDLGEHPTEFADSVILTVRVTEKALEKADLTVYNQAFVKVNGDPEKETEIPENPVPTPDGEPHKIETDPGDGENTIVGQVITYQILWNNYEDVPATVKIRDPLDSHVDFVSASDGGVYTNEDHTVRWDLGEKPAQSSGYVELRVVVTERAKEPGIVYNQAYVQIGNNPEQETEIPENPVPDGEPHKTEVDPGDKKPVDVRQIIMYRIDWWNYKGEPAIITIRDPLDVGLTFFGATDGGVYDSATRTVTWNLGERAAGESGSVFLRCIVNPRARQNGIVKNQAFVQVGHDPEQETEIPENPVPTPTPTPPRRPTRKPPTGDDNDPGLWLALLAAMSFGAGAAGVVIHRRRRKEK